MRLPVACSSSSALPIVRGLHTSEDGRRRCVRRAFFAFGAGLRVGRGARVPSIAQQLAEGDLLKGLTLVVVVSLGASVTEKLRVMYDAAIVLREIYVQKFPTLAAPSERFALGRVRARRRRWTRDGGARVL